MSGDVSRRYDFICWANWDADPFSFSSFSFMPYPGINLLPIKLLFSLIFLILPLTCLGYQNLPSLLPSLFPSFLLLFIVSSLLYSMKVFSFASHLLISNIIFLPFQKCLPLLSLTIKFLSEVTIRFASIFSSICSFTYIKLRDSLRPYVLFWWFFNFPFSYHNDSLPLN